MSWLEVSLQLDGELVEPAAELLGRIAPGGLAIEPYGELHLLRAWLPQDEQAEIRLDQLERGLWHLSQITPFPKPRYRRLPAVDWEASWRRHYRPLAIGKRLMVQGIVPKSEQPEGAGSGRQSPSVVGEAKPQSINAKPPWNDAFELIGLEEAPPPDPSRITLYLEPGMAFGTGTHPSTRHCLELLERRVRPGDRVLDLGCGSGILAIAAARLGARSVLALDVDPEAVQLARRNVQHNQLAEQVWIESGSLAEVPSQASFELIVANIHAAVIERLLQQGLADKLAGGGVLILSGILDEQLSDIEAQAARSGLRVERRRVSRDWRTLVLRQAVA